MPSFPRGSKPRFKKKKKKTFNLTFLKKTETKLTSVTSNYYGNKINSCNSQPAKFILAASSYSSWLLTSFTLLPRVLLCCSLTPTDYRNERRGLLPTWRLIVANELEFYANNNLEGFILFPYKYKSDPKAAARRQQRWERRAPRRNKAAREQADVGSRFFC